MSFAEFFNAATGIATPYPYQTALAERSDWPGLLDVPTGLGKTAAVTLSWLYKRGWRAGGRGAEIDPETPRRLVWCLPMRVLVEQTERTVKTWLDKLGVLGAAGENKVSVHLLMGGESDLKSWAEHPEEDMILIGTQDMLLSRALMRGYGMSRYQWPVHFAFLHNDCLWAFDEVQLMGAGLATSAQLEAFRRRLPLARSSHSLWLSATLNPQWLATVDMKPHIEGLRSHGLFDADRTQAGERLDARKAVERSSLVLDADAGKKAGAMAYARSLCEAVLANHEPGTQTLVILNRVDRAQNLFKALRSARPDADDLLIHARFRPAERRAIEARLSSDGPEDRIVVATQAIEAGVDMSSKLLFTELAPWSSLVQRFGRCNRYGEHNGTGGARVFWIDATEDADCLPYDAETLAQARTLLEPLADVGPANLPPSDQSRPMTPALRRKDLMDLFNTDPDLSGFDVDVSGYIRDTDNPGLQVFWRDVADPNDPEPQHAPSRDELCPISMGQAKPLAKRTAWRWDSLSGRWERLRGAARPGMVVMLAAKDGGYDPEFGFLAGSKKAVSVPSATEARGQERFDADWRSRTTLPITLEQHLSNAAGIAEALCEALAEKDFAEDVIRASRWHDLGKAHEIFDATMHACDAAPQGYLAKSPCAGKHGRPYFRHELASALAWLANHDTSLGLDIQVNRIAYLIAAHHGKVRMSLRAMPAEDAPSGGQRFARGIWEGDRLPGLDFDGERSEPTELKLALMELGQGEQGLSWAARTLALLDEHGPFLLAWLESLVRIADWRASAREQLAETDATVDTSHHGLENQHRALAQADPGAEAGDSAAADSPEGGEQHGVRGGTGGQGDVGARTRTPDHATREIETALGVIPYAELSNHLSVRVEQLAVVIAEGEFDDRPLDEALIRELHGRICGDLTPQFAGIWRQVDVVVGTHEPPPPWQLAPAMRDFLADLRVRLEHLAPKPDELWLETLAFAEGRLLSIHPFQDFNGRLTRVFIDLLLARLDLPDVEPIPAYGQPTQTYLDALRAADQNDWRPLMTIWKQRLEEASDHV